jgi:hypothetical protein
MRTARSRTSGGNCLGIITISLTEDSGIKPGTVHHEIVGEGDESDQETGFRHYEFEERGATGVWASESGVDELRIYSGQRLKSKRARALGTSAFDSRVHGRDGTCTMGGIRARRMPQWLHSIPRNGLSLRL